MKAEKIVEFDYAMNKQIRARVTRVRVEKGMMSKDVSMRMNITESHDLGIVCQEIRKRLT